MCLAIPSKVVGVDKARNMALLDTMGVRREASLDLMSEEVHVGEFVLLHIGYVMSKIDEESAKESLELYEDIVADLRAEDELIAQVNADVLDEASKPDR